MILMKIGVQNNIMEEYLKIFIDKEYPTFIDKYLNTDTLNRLKHITQFCGCDYTKLYSPLFYFTRFNHSLVVAHMTWHFTHNKKETLVALFHDVGTPCFAHTIDCVFGDCINQESSEKSIIEIMKKDKQLMKYLEEDNISIDSFEDFSNYYILENKSPKLCTDRLDGVLHTSYIWLHTCSLDEIKEVYDNIIVLDNEDGHKEIGFKDIDICNKFVKMVHTYAIELQGNVDKYVMKYISEIVKLAVDRKLLTLEDLYNMNEKDICKIFNENFKSWKKFSEADTLIRSDKEPKNVFFVSFDTKKRNTIPLVKIGNDVKRIKDISEESKKLYDEYDNYHDTLYAYLKEIKELD